MFPNVRHVQQELEELRRLRILLANGVGEISRNDEIISHPKFAVENTWNGLPGL